MRSPSSRILLLGEPEALVRACWTSSSIAVGSLTTRRARSVYTRKKRALAMLPRSCVRFGRRAIPSWYRRPDVVRSRRTARSVVAGGFEVAGGGVSCVGPTGTAQDEAQPVRPAGRPRDVAEDAAVLVARDLRQVEGVDVLREPVDDGLALGLERAEELVPHDEDAAVVAVEVLVVRAVVHPVV